MENKNEYNQSSTEQEAIMNRVNQTFDKIAQDVREMIQENKQQKENELS